MVTFNVNGKVHQIDVPADMPVLWVLRDVLGMTGTKFGCGMALSGACTMQLDGQAIRSCVKPVSAAADKTITTIEAIGDTSAGKKLQTAWIALDVPQCGCCQSGQASALLARNAHPTDADIDRRDGGQHLPLRHLRASPGRDQAGGARRKAMTTVSVNGRPRRATRGRPYGASVAP
jgi:isoquinoline 1-oxidoreductase alpha subunit